MCFVLPYRWAIPALVYSMYTNFPGDVPGTLPCIYGDLVNDSAATVASVVCKPRVFAASPGFTPGFYCPQFPPATCYGSNGREVLMSLGKNIKTFTTDDILVEYTGYVLLIAAGLKLLYSIVS